MLAKTFPIGLSIKNAFVGAWHYRVEWLKIGLTPTVMQCIVSIVFGYYHASELGKGEGAYSFIWLELLLPTMIWVMFAVKAYRYVILGEKAKGWFYLEWTRRHWRMLGYWTVLFIGWVLAAVSFMSLVFFLMTLGQTPETLSDAAQFQFIFLSGVFLFFVGLYMVYRLAFLSSALAISHDAPIKNSLEKTQGLNWLRLMACGLLISIPFFIFQAVFDGFGDLGLLKSEWSTGGSTYDEKFENLAVFFENNQPSIFWKYIYVPFVFCVRGILNFQLFGSIYKELDQN